MLTSLRLAKNHWVFQSAPITIDDINKNQTLRTESVKEIKVTQPTADDKKAAQQFWRTQTYFFIRRVHANREAIANLFPEEFSLSGSLCKENLLGLLEKIIDTLERKKITLEDLQTFIDLFILSNPSVASNPQEEKKEKNLSSKEKPNFYIQKADSIAFAFEQAKKNKKVLIMDAANAQRPGAGAYEKGTFQEALTCFTDLYWKILLDFRDVAQELKGKNEIFIPEEKEVYSQINVTDFKKRFLKLILFFIKKSLVDEEYFGSFQFRHDFFNYANSIYGDMQNKVLEIPSDSGFLKKTFIANPEELKEIKKTSDFFEQTEGVLKRQLFTTPLPTILITEVAAPDKRKIVGRYDRASSFSKVLQNSDQPEVAKKIIQDAIHYTLKQAIEKNVDIIILNGFGCGAFENDPTEVATIFAEALQAKKNDLKGKSIYFMDTSSQICHSFGGIFSEKLKDHFNFISKELEALRKLCEESKFSESKNTDALKTALHELFNQLEQENEGPRKDFIIKKTFKLVQALNKTITKENKQQAIKHYAKACQKKISLTSKIGKIIGCVILGALGFVAGAFVGGLIGTAVGAFSGPGAILTGGVGFIAGGCKGMSVGLGLGLGGATFTGLIVDVISYRCRFFKPRPPGPLELAVDEVANQAKLTIGKV